MLPEAAGHHAVLLGLQGESEPHRQLPQPSPLYCPTQHSRHSGNLFRLRFQQLEAPSAGCVYRKTEQQRQDQSSLLYILHRPESTMQDDLVFHEIPVSADRAVRQARSAGPSVTTASAQPASAPTTSAPRSSKHRCTVWYGSHSARDSRIQCTVQSTLSAANDVTACSPVWHLVSRLYAGAGEAVGGEVQVKVHT